MLLTATAAQAQISIGGKVFGGARQAVVQGNASVIIHGGTDTEGMSDMITITGVYGGNDIAGTVNSGSTVTTDGGNLLFVGQLFGGGNGDYEYTLVAEGDEDAEGHAGTYRMTQLEWNGTTWVTKTLGYVDTKPASPEITNAAINLQSGTFGYVYGGGNAATVTESASISIQIPNTVAPLDINGADDATNSNASDDLISDAVLQAMGINTEFFNQNGQFHISRLFGGNNKAEMAIQPTWNLQKGKIEYLYSGGNEGKMTSETGLLLEINPSPDGTDEEKKQLVVENVFGGCRKADVDPQFQSGDKKGDPVDHVDNLYGYSFPKDFAARVIVRGGDINNVYGGNDVSGHVKFGNAVGVYTSIRGNVYGGGNGSYAYTDNADIKNQFPMLYGDFYYDVNQLLEKQADNDFSGHESAQTLNLFRPDAEQVSILVRGTEGKPTIIGGSIFCGGNSATLKLDPVKAANDLDYPNYPVVELKVGSYVVANEVFLGNNGADMVKKKEEAISDCVLYKYAHGVNTSNGEISETGTLGFSKMDFTATGTDSGTGRTQFEEYMEGCAMGMIPSVTFDDNYVPYSTYIGSLYCGGNVGSMTVDGLMNISFNDKIVVFDKVVGGCNNANVAAVDGYNTAYYGGLIGSPDTDTGNKLELTFNGLKIEPKRWAVKRDANYEKVLDANSLPTYLLTSGTNPHRYLEWNTVDSREYDTATKTYKEMAPVTTGTGESSAADLARRLYGGNVYGGCCESGIVNGNVVINLNASLVERDVLFDEVTSDELGEEVSLYGSTQTEQTNYNILERRTGVILGQQGMDVFGSALNVFGGGKGKDTEIWGSTVINLNRGYTFQIFGGSEEGVIGKSVNASTANDYIYTDGKYTFNRRQYEFNPNYSCYVNLCGTKAGVSKAADSSEDMAECEFMYGGGFFGPIAGNTVINLGKGRIFNSFAGSCNGDILGTAETYVGRQVKAEYRLAAPTDEVATEDNLFEPGFPWVRDNVYGGNDLGGRILGTNDYHLRVRGQRSFDTAYPFSATGGVFGRVHPKDADNDGTPDVLQASAYVEYLQGRVDAIFGGHYGTYDYKENKFDRYTNGSGDPLTFDNGDLKFYKPRLDNAFVNFRPTYYNSNNVVKNVFGASQGQSGEKERDLIQNRSYVLIDIPQISGEENNENFNKYTEMQVFGAGAWGGVGMKYSYEETTAGGFNLDRASAIVDLVRGDIGAAYGASFEEGVTRRTVVNVPQGSTIKIGSIFGGGYGTQTYKPCDVYEAHVEYHSADAVLVNNRPRVENNQNLGSPLMLGAIYGGNNSERRTLYGFINIDVPVRQSHYKYGMTTGTVYGAGYGSRTWNEYTQIDLQNGAEVYEVYGGGEAGGVMGAESIGKYYVSNPYNIAPDAWKAAWSLGGTGYDPAEADFTKYADNTPTNLNNPMTRTAEMDDRTVKTYKYNTNVIIHEGAYVGNYAYAGGYGTADKFAGSGDVYGSTYLALLGGTVNKDIYAACTSGSVYDLFGVGKYDAESNPNGFTATTNVYVKGGTVRNVYGGGWRGSVGYHGGAISNVANNANDRDGESHLVIGDLDGSSHVSGIPSITRNIYGGGEGGAIYGDAYVTINKGYIGFRYNGEAADDAATVGFDERYIAELDEAKPGDHQLDKGGNVFGGGYVANSYVDRSHVTMWDGTVRGGLYGGGEIGPIGRGTVHPDTLALLEVEPYLMHNHTGSAQPAAIFKGGETNVYLYGGHVMRDVFGGGRGYDNWGGEGFFQSQEEKDNMDRSSKGYVFGQTKVHIYGGEIGTEEGVLQGYGNVFGGGNEGFIYSATGQKVGSDRSDEHLTNGVPTDGGGFYYEGGSKTNPLTTDCYVEIAPRCKVLSGTLSFTANAEKGVKASYGEGDYVPVAALNQLKNWNGDASKWAQLDTRGITIHNAVFAGGNITEGSDKLFANTTTVYGNAAVSLRDVYNIDLISLGTEDMGGLYGDGNLTLVDGFREIHIDNYGTDYYSLNETMELAEYNNLTERQQAYYKLKYVSNESHQYVYYESKSLHTYTIKDSEGNVISSTPYKKGQKVTAAVWETFSDAEKANWAPGNKTYQKDDQIEEGEYILMDEDEQDRWDLFGVTSIYAGRPMNTIQRADMCGVFGSRMVLKGAQDRVVEAVDYSNYTINRVDEVSLNKRVSEAGDTGTDAVHGNYFGIYNVVNYLGNLTSDVFFTETNEAGDAVRETDTDIQENKADGTTTYYQWKAARPQGKNRNNATSRNKVALASGVYLEIKREEGEKTGQDDWGYITGVVELDLINVMPGMGGGFVYARNEHGIKEWHGAGSTHGDWGKVTMLAENENARTYRRFKYIYEDESHLQPIQTSGNFVHNTKQIVDDCYPNTGIYKDGYVASPAHYWYIRGSIYVYDQYISAYTGSANAYAEKVELPLTISAAANGRLTLRDVQPNYYAYYDKNGNKLGDASVNADEQLIINNTTYRLNDPVSYWDYRLMSEADKARFVEETYVVIEDCRIGDTEYKKDDVLLPSDYTTLRGSGDTGPTVTYYEEDGVEKTDGDFDYFFRLSNNLSHSTGYVLTYDVNNPTVWDNYYTKSDKTDKLGTKGYNDLTSGRANYVEGPTYTPKPGTNGVFGQQDIKQGDIVYGKTKTSYESTVSSRLGANPPTQAIVNERAYIVTSEYSVKDADGHEVQHLNPGTPIYQSKYTDAQWAAITTNQAAELAHVCTNLLEISATDYVYAGQLLTAADVADLKAKVIEKNGYEDDDAGTADAKATAYLNDYIDDAWYCTSAGKYGGTYFEAGKAYRAIDTWCAMSDEDRQNFVYNYDALDLLIDHTYDGRLESNYGFKPQYDGYAPGSTADAVANGTASVQHDGSTPLNPTLYSKSQPIDYMAEFTGIKDADGGTVTNTLSYTDEGGQTRSYTANANQSGWLTREQYEDIPNEQHHYSPISITAPGSYYVVNKAFMRGDVPFTIGQQRDETTYNSMTADQKSNIDVLNFAEKHTTKVGEEYQEKKYYYCREAYTVNEKGMGQSVTTMGIKTGTSSVTYDKDNNNTVPMGVIIDQENYNNLINLQSGNFLIHGTSPTEVSTLYVSGNSDINDLSKEKIITVIYLYEYEESDESGLNVTPVSERHIVNIHINFKSGVPEIGEVNPPALVLPGTTLGLNTPSVTQGAFRVTESGWEIFANGDDATTHTNGAEYRNNEDPVYWYQNNYWIAYYAKTRLGKTYSNSVPVSVGNYHDLKKVMDDNTHHYFIDHKDVEYEPKIYINDYKTDDPATSQNGLDLLKDLMDLTHGKTVDGHEPLILDNPNKPIKNAKFLEFFLRADQDHSDSEWTPIANGDDECFSGVLHGDGHAISGLDHSLFNHLCGDVYNLGVTGSFTGAGIAETGEGYVENCWVKSSATSLPDGATKVNAVFGDPSTSDDTKQVVNCYFWDGNKDLYNTATSGDVITSGGDHGQARAMTEEAFYNGTVTYDLNGFYLYKRYSDQATTSGTAYQFYTVNADGTLSDHPQTKWYASNPVLCSSGYVPSNPTTGYVPQKYVEDRFADGDFRYADGTIPSTDNERLYTWEEEDGRKKTAYYPIWPDDYLFFGQALNYGHMDGKNGRDLRTHQDLPTAINRSNERLLTTSEGNRVYRAPAYFRSSKMGVAHFNPYAVFAAKEKLTDEQVADNVTPRQAYKDMTAIDFTGSNGDLAGGYHLGWRDRAADGFAAGTPQAFYPPLLDDDGLQAIYNADLTRNLLAYTMTTTTAAAQTNGVVSGYLQDESYVETHNTYHTVDDYDFHSDNIRGHWVQKQSDGRFVSKNDHLLVDRQDFNAPIGYTFASNRRMWYQRQPDNYVGQKRNGTFDNSSGWEGVSLPFKADIVTTDVKGEITHFYGGSWESKNDTHTKIGHEYWLRGFTGGAVSAEDNKVFKATFNYPEPNANDGRKENTNTFLWDYYYSYQNYKDLNRDDYQEDDDHHDYYKTPREYPNYPRLASGTPYIIGFPGERYYEFDLSGQFEALTALSVHPTRLEAQTITFASATGATIHVSDEEMDGVTNTADGKSFTFKPNYLNEAFEAGTDNYTLADDGSCYDKVPDAPGAGEPAVADTRVSAFRPYFTSAEVASGGARPVTRSIVFSNEPSQLKADDEHGNLDSDDLGNLKIYAKKHKIVVESALTRDIDVRILTPAGVTLTTFTLEPGETIETRIVNAGVYIVQSADGRYTKKLVVR